jgi:uroporphyrinogen decarboxylase
MLHGTLSTLLKLKEPTMRNKTEWFPLPREEVVKALERRGPARIPLVRTKWWGEGLEDHYGDRLRRFDRFPEDVVVLFCEPVVPEQMGLSWPVKLEGPHDARVVLDDWAKLDEFVAKLPDPDQDPRLDQLALEAEQIRAEGRYLLFGWWRLFFEKPWALRGMQNLLLDFVLAPDQIHRLHDALCTHYSRYLNWAIREIQPDGFWTSDDLGHQKQLFMSPATFRALIKPYYARIGALLDAHHLHWWLHSCGNNTPVLDDLIEVGVDVFHPVQKGTMDYATTAATYGDRMTFLVGFDVQHVLPEATPEAVRAEVRAIVDLFDRPDGGLCLAAGNGILPGTPLANIEAFLDEALRYGQAHRARFAAQPA